MRLSVVKEHLFTVIALLGYDLRELIDSNRNLIRHFILSSYLKSVAIYRGRKCLSSRILLPAFLWGVLCALVAAGVLSFEDAVAGCQNVANSWKRRLLLEWENGG